MESRENYLKAVYRLTDSGESSTTTSKVASELEVSDASASEAIQKLEEEKLICRAPYKGFTLSPPGKKEAKNITEKYEILKKFLEEILDVEDAEEQAEKIKHHLTTETIEELKKINNEGR